MDKFVVVQDNGLMQFVAGERKPWQLWKKPILLSPFNAATFDLHKSNEMRDKTQDIFKDYIVLSVNYDISQLGLVSDGGHLGQYKYFVVAGRSKYLHKTEYYSYDKEYYNKKLKRRMAKPVFDKDINEACFIKSYTIAEKVLNRCRQTGREMVMIKEVYVYRENELLENNIILVLRPREEKGDKKDKPLFLRSWDLKHDKLYMTSNFRHAERYTFDEYLKVYDELHALHKGFLVLPKIVDDTTSKVNPKSVDGRERVEVTMKLRNKKEK